MFVTDIHCDMYVYHKVTHCIQQPQGFVGCQGQQHPQHLPAELCNIRR